MLDKGKLVAVVSMDLSKAFDVIQHNQSTLSKTQVLWCGREKFCAIQGFLKVKNDRYRGGHGFESR